MALKPITRQEQIIAGKNLEPITRMEQFLKEYGGGTGGSVQSDWNQNDSSAADFIKNKPFGDSPTGGDTLYWDGNTEGLETDGVNYKVSDAVPSIEDFANDYIITINTGESMSGTDADFPAEETEFGIVFQGGMVVNVEERPLPKGVYLYNGGGVYVSSLTIPCYTGFPVTEKIDSKYYVGSTMFYSYETYLYTDALYTTKATRADVVKAMGRGTIAVFMGGVDAWAPCNINVASYDYAVVACMTWQGEDTLQTKFFYTAEYTP